MPVNKDRVELFAAALESDKYHQCGGQLKMRGLALPDTRVVELHCALGVATEVALDNGLYEEIMDNVQNPRWHLASLWSSGVLHPLVAAWYGWCDMNSRADAIDPRISEDDSISGLNDNGADFWTIAQALRATYLKDEG